VIIGLTIYEGNPADSSNLQRVVSSLVEVYGARIRDIVADGGYNSMKNLEEVKKLGVEKMVFTRKRSVSEEAMGTTKEKYQSDKNFRTGIERAIGRLKQRFGFRKVICTTMERFKLYLTIGVLAANLCRIALF
jgi:IS5 family transposase